MAASYCSAPRSYLEERRTHRISAGNGLVKDLSVIEIPAYFGTTILTQRPAESLAAQLERTLAQTVPRVA